MSAAAARRLDVPPAAIGSVLLHAAVAAAFMISWGARDLKVGAVVPVTIVADGPSADPRPAEQGAQNLEAMTEAPAPEAPPEPVPPPPTPSTKAPTPAEKAPAPKAKAPTQKAEASLDLDALAASLTAPARNRPQRPSAATKGPNRPETATAARDTAGLSAAAGLAMSGLAEELQRRWNPNCDVMGGRDVVVRVVFRLGVGGQVVGEPESEIKGPRTAVAQAGAERAVRAVYAAAPFRGLPREFYGERIAVNFNAREACER